MSTAEKIRAALDAAQARLNAADPAPWDVWDSVGDDWREVCVRFPHEFGHDYVIVGDDTQALVTAELIVDIANREARQIALARHLVTFAEDMPIAQSLAARGLLASLAAVWCPEPTT